MPFEILLVDDNAGDVRLFREAFGEVVETLHVHVANDGFEAMAFGGDQKQQRSRAYRRGKESGGVETKIGATLGSQIDPLPGRVDVMFNISVPCCR
jgi:hypothetical protein